MSRGTVMVRYEQIKELIYRCSVIVVPFYIVDLIKYDLRVPSTLFLQSLLQDISEL